MSVIEFIGFIIVMVASVILSFKRNREKKESLDIFEQFEEKPRRSSMPQEEFEDSFEEEEDEEEEEVLEKKYVVSDVVTPPLPTAPLAPIKKEFLKKDIAFDFHNDAISKKGMKSSESGEFVLKKASLRNSIVIQEILNKPKGW